MSERQPVEWVAGVLGWTPGSDDQRAAVVAAVDAWEADRAELDALRAERDTLRLMFEAEASMRSTAVARIATLEAQLEEWREKAKNWMASPAAQQQLDGYRELAGRVAAAEDRIATLEAQRDALVPLAQPVVQEYGERANRGPLETDEFWAELLAARAALAAIAAERETTTEEDGK